MQVHPDGSAEVFVSFPLHGQDTQSQLESSTALDALLWGYCDPQARFPVNCPVRPVSSQSPPQVTAPRQTAPPSSRDTADKPPSVSKSQARRWQQQLMTDAAGFGCSPWTRKEERTWTPRDNAYDFGAAAAIQCDAPASGLKQLAMFRFPNHASLEAYWDHKLSIINKRLRPNDEACFAGKQGITGWTSRSGASRGLVACYVDGVAKIRWYNLRNNTYGILDANHKSVLGLVGWWTRWSP